MIHLTRAIIGFLILAALAVMLGAAYYFTTGDNVILFAIVAGGIFVSWATGALAIAALDYRKESHKRKSNIRARYERR